MNEAHIYIYGIIDGFQDENTGAWGCVNLKDVKRQMDAQPDAESITVHIHSPGGYVSEGFAIHDFLRSQGKPVTTLIEGECYSIATVIALAGDTRKMTSNADFMIHMPWGGAMGDSEQIEKYANSLKNEEDRIAEFYAAKTKISKDDLLEMMRNETYMSAEKALEHGFITEIAVVMKAVARLKPNNNNNEMSKENLTKKDAEGLFASFEAKMKSLFGGSQPQAKLVQDANGDEINFPNLEADETPSVGDRATIDGQPANGEYLMPSGETYVFTDGELTEIREEEEDDTNEQMENLKKQLQEAQAKAQKIQKEKQDVQKELDSLQDNVKEMQKEFQAFKKTIGSNFTHDGDGKKNYKDDQEQKIRTI